MPVSSTVPTSRRGYLSQAELAQFADITITDTTEADDQISQAEEIIDAYVGVQPKFLDSVISGLAAAITASTLTLQTNQQNNYEADFFKGCEIELVGGTGAGQRRTITGSTKAGVITVANWATLPDTTTFYRIYQLGKFPRQQDVIGYSEVSPIVYYKQIPEAVKRAVAAQVEYMIRMGDAFFATDQSDKQSESIGDYSYTNAQGAAGTIQKFIAPKAKMYLRGIHNRLGVITT